MNASQSIMNDQHCATPEQWQAIKANGHLPTRSTILELLHRVQALEATQHAHVDLSHLSDAERERMLKSIANPGRFEALEAAATEAQLNHPTKPDSSLVDRIKSRMIQGVGCTWEKAATSVLLEVAAWLRKESNVHFEVDEFELYKAGLHWAKELEQEAKR